MIIGKLVREYRLKKNLSQQELADLSELSLPFINLVENNRRNLSVDTLLRILQAMEIEPSDFFKPLSYSSNQDLQLLIEKLQVKEDSSEYIKVFLNILRLSEDR